MKNAFTIWGINNVHYFDVMETEFADLENLIEKVHEMINKYPCVCIKNEITGKELSFNRDEYFEKYYFEGEIKFPDYITTIPEGGEDA